MKNLFCFLVLSLLLSVVLTKHITDVDLTSKEPSGESKSIVSLTALKLLSLGKLLWVKAMLLLSPKTVIVINVTDNPNPSTTEKTQTSTEVCNITNDLVVAIDDSGSIGSDNFNIVLNFTANLASSWRRNSGNRVAIAFFSNNILPLISLSESEELGPLDIYALIRGSGYRAGSRESIPEAIEYGIDEFNSNGRRGIDKNLIVLTDGQSDKSMTAEAAERFASLERSRAFAVGVGSNVDLEQLGLITGNNDNHVLHVDQFEELLAKLDDFAGIICKG